MRPSLPLLLAAAALAVSACSAAQGTPAAPTTAVPSPSPGASDASPTTTVSTPPTTTIPSTATSTGASASPTPTSVVDQAAIGAPAPVESLILGDSISLGIADALSTYGYPVIGLVGQSATSGYLREHLSSDLAQAARTWVIVLGTNNSGSPEDVAQLPDLIALIDSLRTPGAKQQVRWVTPHRPPTYIGTKTAYNLDAFNAELSLLAMSHRWLRILDFDAQAKAHPEWFDEDTAMHLHPNADGRAALVALITGPAPRPAASRAPVIDAGATAVEATEEPEVFDNSTFPPAPPTPAAPPVSPAASPAPASPAPPVASASAAPAASVG